MARRKQFSSHLLAIFFFNLLELLHHKVSAQEIGFIKKTELFNNIESQQFQKIIHSIRLVKYPKDSIVFSEDDIADALYIISEGSVRVFTYDFKGNKIPLARLNQGDYFGEQALLGEENKTRNASIETIDETTLIKINANKVFPLLNEDHKLKKKLKNLGYDHIIHSLNLSTQFYTDIKPIIDQIDEKKIIELKKNENIFNFGDKAKDVYLILSGKVKLIFPAADGEKESSINIHKGHLLGEVGVLDNKPRSATAIAVNHVRLLAIDGNQFKSKAQASLEIQNLLTSLKHIYKLPRRGIVEQYIGSEKDIGPTITNIFKMDDGRSIIAVRALNQDLFTMSASDAPNGVEYKYEKTPQNFTKLVVANNHFVHIESCGGWEDLPNACKMLLDNEVIEKSNLEKFPLTGELIKAISDADIICKCMSITKDQLQAVIDQGIKDFDTLSRETGACTVCGSCRYSILEMLGENPWVAATMQRIIQHNKNIHSYLIKPTNSKLNPFMPGQYVIIQARVHGNWVERSYSMSNIFQEEEPYRITIKKEPKGLFTTWLFDEAPEEFSINVGQPTGNFTLNNDVNTPALCFAGGVGIVPFVSIAKDLMQRQHNKKTHILYCAMTDQDFIFTDEFGQITEALSSFSVSYRTDAERGFLTKEEIISIVESYPKADVYICGPEGFKNLIIQTLQSINYDPNKIHIEIFLHVGSPTTK